MTPRELLHAADMLLSGHSSSMERCWQRACAALLRVALELALDQYWQRRAPGLIRATTRSQLLVLPTLAGEGPARTARSSWYGLCRAVHHHSYELAPTAAELRGWHDDIAGLLNHL
jgi:hypothetical protein